MRRSLSLVWSIAVLASGCTSDPSRLPSAPPDVVVTLRAVESIDAVVGTSGRGSVEIVRTGDTRGALTLEFEGVPVGVRVTFDDDVAPTLRSGRAFFSLSIRDDAPPGTYQLTVRVRVDGRPLAIAPLSLIIRRLDTLSPPSPPAATPAIALTTAHSTVTMGVGSRVDMAVLAVRNPMYDWDVYLSARNVPDKVVVSFDPDVLNGFYNITRSNLAITIAADAVPGTYPIEARAVYEDGSWSTSTIVNLIIVAR